jgi:hypothetical protein
MRFLIGALIGWRLFYAGTLTVLQYFVFLPPFREPKYFLLYSWTHFWFNFVLSVGTAFVFYLFLKFLKKRNERFFEEGEAEIGFLCALIAGWPDFVVFLPLVLVLVALESVFRKIFLKESLTTLGFALILAAITAFIFGDKIIAILSLGALRI